MKCIVCEEEIRQGQGICACCGFPVIVGTAGTKEEQKALRQFGEQYQRKQLEQMRVDLVTYQYAYKNGHLRPSGEQTMRIFDGAVIPKESQKNVDNMIESEGRPWINEANADTQTQIIWHPQKICQLQSGKTYELCPKVSYKDQTHEHHVKIKAPKVDGYTYAGLMIDRGFRAKLIVGDAQNYSCSEEFCLIQ